MAALIVASNGWRILEERETAYVCERLMNQ
jgi:hypothetical protein